MDTATIRADIAKALEAALTALPNVTVYAYWIDNASVPAVVIDDHEAHVDNRVRINTWIVRVILPDGAKEDAYRLGDDIITLLTPLTVDPHSLAVASIIPTSALVAQQNLPGYTLNLTDDRKALCAERPQPPQPIPATGAVMGKPGYFTPVGSVPPADAVELESLTATPATAWDPGTYVIVTDLTEWYWDGDSWEGGHAPTPPPPQLVLTVTDQTDLTVAVAITNEDPAADPATVDWDDGSITADLDHTYADPGTYTLIAEQVGRTDSNPVDVTVTAPPVSATGATTGTPGTFTPTGSVPPANFAALTALTATPATKWTEGQYVVCANADEGYWDGDSWEHGRAPAPPSGGLVGSTFAFYGYVDTGGAYSLNKASTNQYANIYTFFGAGHTPPPTQPPTGGFLLSTIGLTITELRAAAGATAVKIEPSGFPATTHAFESFLASGASADDAAWFYENTRAIPGDTTLTVTLVDNTGNEIHAYPTVPIT